MGIESDIIIIPKLRPQNTSSSGMAASKDSIFKTLSLWLATALPIRSGNVNNSLMVRSLILIGCDVTRRRSLVCRRQRSELFHRCEDAKRKNRFLPSVKLILFDETTCSVERYLSRRFSLNAIVKYVYKC